MTQLDLFTDSDAPPDQPGRPAPYPPPELRIGITVAAAYHQPDLWVGRLVFTSIDRTGGYRGHPGWYRLAATTLTTSGSPSGYPAVAATVTDNAGRQWLSSLLPRGSITVEATPAEWAESIEPLPDEAPGFRIHPTYYHRKDTRHA